MKKLTVNRIAGAGLIANRRGYRSLGVGVFLSIFLISALCLCVQGVFLAQEEKRTQKYGRENCFILNDSDTDEGLTATGLFDRIGHITVIGSVEKTGVYLGFYDEEATSLMNRRLSVGRMPEQPGEIAVEPSALERMGISASLGDMLTLKVTPIDGLAETRAFTVVGVLNEQTVYLDVSGNYWVSNGTTALPAVLTCDREMEFQTGRTVTHRALTLAPLIALDRVFAYAEEHYARGWVLVGVTPGGVAISQFDTRLSDESFNTLMLLGMLGASLVLAVCVGIAGAMEGQLARKTEEIGMLRAVGATRRQIRRIFGREAWLLMLIMSPLAVGAGCLFAGGLSRFAPEEFAYRPAAWLLLPILALSCACIYLSSNLPLRRAARIMPMSVMRDTALLRKTRAIRARTRFRADRLIAWRQIRLHPTRQLGASTLTALLMTSILLLTGVLSASGMMRDAFTDNADFEIFTYSYARKGIFCEIMPDRALTNQDFEQLAAVPGVSRVEAVWALSVNEITDHVPSFYAYGDQFHLMTEEEYRNDQVNLQSMYADDGGDSITADQIDLSYWQVRRAEHDAARDAAGVSREQSLIAHKLIVCAVDESALAPYVAEGKINLRAIDEGREVLAYAPDLYTIRMKDHVLNYHFKPDGDRAYTYHQNDSFTAGREISLMQLCAQSADENTAEYEPGESYEHWYSLYHNLSRADATVTIGAVLRSDTEPVPVPGFEPCLITRKRARRRWG